MNKKITKLLVRLSFAALFFSSVMPVNAIVNLQTRIAANRLSFGANPDEQSRIDQLGFNGYLEEQLNPSQINDSAFENKYLNPSSKNFVDPTQTRDEDEYGLEDLTLLRMAFSKKQLQEVMTYFWDNHFSTQLHKQGQIVDVEGGEFETNLRGEVLVRPLQRRFDIIANPLDIAQQIDLSSYDKVRIEMKTKRVSKNAQLIMFPIFDDDLEEGELAEEADEEDAEKEEVFFSRKFKLKSNKKFNTYDIDVGSDPNWRGNLDSLSISLKRTARSKLDQFPIKVRSFKLMSSTNPSIDIEFIINDLALETAENDFFRANAFGRFEDLALFSAKSPRMLIYLDNWLSKKGNPNENYAREFLELYTMGVDGGYTQADVVGLAAALTGWTAFGNGFFFDSAGHDSSGVKLSFLSTTVSGGLEQGETLVKSIANTRATAEFICQKLIRLFVNDTARSRSDSLVASCASTFQAKSNSNDQIGQVLRVIFNSSEFNAEVNYRAKIETPLEFVINRVRKLNLDNGLDLDTMKFVLRQQRYVPFANPVPTGYAELGSKWLGSSSQLLSRIDYNDALLFNDEALNNYIDYLQRFTDGSRESVADFVIEQFVGDTLSEATRAEVLATLPANFELESEDGDVVLALIRLVMNLPEASFH